MTVAASPFKVSYNYAGIGSATVFPYTFRILQAADLVVTKYSATGVPALLVLTTDYALDGVLVYTGGNVTLNVPLVSGESVTLFRDPALAQLTAYPESSTIPPPAVENNLDLLTMVEQASRDRSLRGIHVPAGENPTDAQMTLPPAAQRKGQMVYFDALTGQQVTTGAPPATGVISAAMQAVTSAATTALARIALGISSAMDAVITSSTLVAARAAMGPWGDIALTATDRTLLQQQGDVFNVRNYPYLAKGDWNGSTGTDDGPAFQAAINACLAAGGGLVFVPPGRYRIATRLKIQNTYAASKSMALVGCGAGWQNVAASGTQGSLLVGDTGGIVIDCAGGSNLTFRDFGIYPGVSTPSTIGMLFQRISTSQFCQNNRFQRVSINMGTDGTANGGLGRFGIVNKRGEHWHAQDLSVLADRAVLLDGRSQYATLISPDYAESLPAGASHTNNWFDNCIMYSAIGDSIEMQTCSQIALRGGSFIGGTGKGMAAIYSGVNISMVDFQFESGSNTPTYLVDILNTCQNLTIKGNSATTVAIKGVRCATAGRTVKGLTAEFTGSFALVIDTAAGTGGPVSSCQVKYDTSAGHSIPAGTGEGIYGYFQQEGGSPQQFIYNAKTAEFFVSLTIPKVATASLPAAGASMDGQILIEDTGTIGNLIIYMEGHRYRIAGVAF